MKLKDFSSMHSVGADVPVLVTERDPLHTDDVLCEAYPVSVVFDYIRGRALIILDCRFCDSVIGNSALLTLLLPSTVEWNRPPHEHPGQRTIVGWEVGGSSGWQARASLGWSGDESLFLSGPAALFVSGDVPGFDGAPPDFGDDDDDTIDAGLPSLESTFVPLAVSLFSGLQASGRSEPT